MYKLWNLLTFGRLTFCRLEFLSSNTTLSNCLVLLYHKYLTSKLYHTFDKFNFKVIYRNINKLNYFISLGKDSINKLEKLGPIYKVNSRNCSKVSIDKTGR